MTPAEVSRMEARVRGAYAQATATIAPDDIPAHAPARPGSTADRLASKRMVRRAVPIVAAFAVLLVVAAALLLPRVLAGPSAHRPAEHPGGAPLYMVTTAPEPALLSVVDLATGKVIARIKARDWQKGSWWYFVAADGPLTFMAGEDQSSSGECDQITTSLYRIQLTSRGSVSSVQPVDSPIRGRIVTATTAPGGTYLGYLLLDRGCLGSPNESFRLVVRDLATGESVASWPVGAQDMIGSLSLSRGGRQLAATTYSYQARTGQSVESLSQRTVVLSRSTSGRRIDAVPAIDSQAGPAVLSPDGGTLYQVVETGRVTSVTWHAAYPRQFALEAINTRTGAVIATLHRWSAVWRRFSPALALDPSGRYLLFADGSTVARLDLRTDSYTALPTLTRALPVGLLLLQGWSTVSLAW